ncbi:MAG: hypothetical protein Q7T71_00815 [Herbiconiux sp.]|nr:hypothetical protein [Herbiconiux sp.]
MGHVLFPDTTVLVNFAHVNMMGALEAMFAGRAMWGATGAAECARSAEVEGLEVLREAIRFLGEPLRPDTVEEHLLVTRLRTQLSGPGDGPRKNLGEAETLALIQLRPALRGVFVTDDTGAIRAATAMGMRVYTSADLFALAAVTQQCTIDEAWNLMMVLRGIPRHLPRCPRHHSDFARRCARPAVV